MFNLADIMNTQPFSLEHKEKTELYFQALSDLTKHHYNRCPPYKNLLDTLEYTPGQGNGVEEIPFVPVRLFKEYDLFSVDQNVEFDQVGCLET